MNIFKTLFAVAMLTTMTAFSASLAPVACLKNAPAGMPINDIIKLCLVQPHCILWAVIKQLFARSHQTVQFDFAQERYQWLQSAVLTKLSNWSPQKMQLNFAEVQIK